MIKHILDDWGISGPKKSWWYKMQLFNREHFAGNMLYLDLDVVLVRELDWVVNCHTDYFWALRDFRYLQNRGAQTLNSSMMWFNVDRFGWVWDDFQKLNLETTVRRYPGDQDYIVQAIDITKRRFFDDKYFESYRWQVMDGGYNFQSRQHYAPNTGATISPDTSVIVFHGHPKPHEVTDPKIVTLWY
jgi:lipopolysaccharide biosynthesis glycosyltransferase